MYRFRNRFGAGAPTLGVFVNWTNEAYQRVLLGKIREFAAKADANVVYFVGGSRPERLEARIYDLAGDHNLNGLILIGSVLVDAVGRETLLRCGQRYGQIPLCSIGVPLPDFPAVTVNNEVGMRESVSHLIEKHGAKKIAFVRGPLLHQEANERVSGYRIALESNGIPFDERLVVTGDFATESGKRALDELVERRGVRLEELDAIVVSNDAMTMGLMLGLEARGIDVPNDVAVVGFDDTEEAYLTNPPLTTARQPLFRMASEAVRLVMSWMQHGERPSGVRLDTEMITRRSCGCTNLPDAVRYSLPYRPTPRPLSALFGQRQQILAELTRSARGTFGTLASNWEERLFAALMSDLNGEPNDGLVPCFSGMLDKLVPGGGDLAACEDVLSGFRSKVIPLILTDAELRGRADDAFDMARIVVGRAMQRGLTRDRVLVGRRARAWADACAAIAVAFDETQLRDLLLEYLPALGIRSYAVVRYVADEPLTGRLFAAYDDHGTKWPLGTTFDAKLLVPADVVQSTASDLRSFALTPLCWSRQHSEGTWEGESLGHVLFEVDDDNYDAYGAIARAISTALRGIKLISR